MDDLGSQSRGGVERGRGGAGRRGAGRRGAGRGGMGKRGRPRGSKKAKGKNLKRVQAHLDAEAVKTRVAAAVLMANPDAFAASGPAVLGGPVSEAAVGVLGARPVATLAEGLALIDWFNAQEADRAADRAAAPQ